MAYGGKREGAGRKKEQRTIEKEKTREFLINKIAKDFDPIVTAQIEAAKGIWVEESDSEGNRIRVYRKFPDLRVGEYLINQGAGKPSESLDLTSGGEKIKGVDIKIRK